MRLLGSIKQDAGLTKCLKNTTDVCMVLRLNYIGKSERHDALLNIDEGGVRRRWFKTTPCITVGSVFVSHVRQVWVKTHPINTNEHHATDDACEAR
jgi:hypothetical protein